MNESVANQPFGSVMVNQSVSVVESTGSAAFPDAPKRHAHQGHHELATDEDGVSDCVSVNVHAVRPGRHAHAQKQHWNDSARQPGSRIPSKTIKPGHKLDGTQHPGNILCMSHHNWLWVQCPCRPEDTTPFIDAGASSC